MVEETSAEDVSVLEAGDVKWGTDSVTGLVGEPGKETRDEVRDAASEAGSVDAKVDDGGVSALPGVTGCVLGTNVEDGTPLVCEGNAWVVREGEVVSLPEVKVSKGANEELVDISDIGCGVERSVVEVMVASPVVITMVLKKVLVPDAVAEGGSVDVVVVKGLVAMGAGVDSTVVSGEWGKVGAEGSPAVWMVPVPLAEVDEEEADVTGRLVAKKLESLPVTERVAVLLGVA